MTERAARTRRAPQPDTSLGDFALVSKRGTLPYLGLVHTLKPIRGDTPSTKITKLHAAYDAN
ncbi:hypothetical protein PATSB16_15580 [Pandoraea thiooxydans]|nr:hypothetical protein PATSB16_15580 [Pandoraea thiooxydans]